MKTRSLILCAVALLTGQTIVLAEKTEVSVKKGKVIAETAKTSVAVDAGRKAILTPGKNPIVTVDNPLVDDVLKLYKLVEEEKEYSYEKIDSTCILVGRADKDRVLGALYFELPNTGSEATNVLRLGSSSVMENIEVYDLNGNLLSVDMKPLNKSTASYSFHFLEKVEPGAHFKMIAVVDLNEIPLLPGGRPAYWKEGPLWYFRTANNVPNCLNYFRFILPESAIFLESNREIVSMDSVDDRVAVTMRNYTGPMANGWCKISFLFPEEDGTSLADIPNKAHIVDEVNVGQRQSEREHNQQGHNTSAATFNYRGLRFAPDGCFSYDMKVIWDQPMMLVCTYWGGESEGRVFDIYVDDVKVTTQELHQNKPGEFFDVEYEIPLELTQYKDKVTIRFQAHPGKIAGSLFGCKIIKSSGASVESRHVSDPSMVTYKGLKVDDFMTRWAFLGPLAIHGQGYPPEEEAQKQAFDSEPFDLEQFQEKITIGDEKYQWEYLHSRKGIVVPPRPSDRLYYVYGYAWAQIDVPEETAVMLGIGSDDSVKVWLNGELVHKHWIARGVTPDEDLVPVTFRKGKNQLVLKIQNGVVGWGFSCRVLKADPKNILIGATYKDLKVGEFMKNWLLLGPIPVTIAGPEPTNYETKNRAFGIDPFSLEQFEPKVRVGGLTYEWTAHRSYGDSVDLLQAYGQKDYAFSYAWSQIDTAKEITGILSIGYDDIIKVWLNGQVIHEHWGLTEADGDLIPVTFREGKNQLVLKILNEVGPWGFTCRLLENN